MNENKFNRSGSKAERFPGTNLGAYQKVIKK